LVYGALVCMVIMITSISVSIMLTTIDGQKETPYGDCVRIAAQTADTEIPVNIYAPPDTHAKTNMPTIPSCCNSLMAHP